MSGEIEFLIRRKFVKFIDNNEKRVRTLKSKTGGK